ncbi:hypothetical protein ACHAXM_002571 [Skeletonema potamos]
MKFQILFLSLLNTTTHARYEPKGLRGGDDHNLELDVHTSVAKGGSARIQCSEGGYCCSNLNYFDGTTNYGGMSFGGDGDCAPGMTEMTDAELTGCLQTECVINCVGSCSVSMQSGGGGKKGRNGNSGGMGGNGGGGGGGGRGKDNVFKHFKDIFGDDKYDDGDDSEGGNDDEAYYLLEE